MPIEELQEPIWEKQKGETPNQYCYFQEFLKWPTFNLKDFHNHLCETYQNLPEPTPKPPKYNTVKGWSSDNNWTLRKESKRKSENDDLMETLHELDKELKIKEFQTKQRINTRILERIEREVDDNALSQLAQGIQGYKTLKDDNRTDMGEATEITNSNINADVDTTLNNPGLNKIAEAYLNGRKQYDDESIS